MAKKRVCMACDSEVGEHDTVCPNCGVDLEFFAVEVEDKKKALDALFETVLGEELPGKTEDENKSQTPEKTVIETSAQDKGPGIDLGKFDLSELEIEEPKKTVEKEQVVQAPAPKPVVEETKPTKVIVEKVEYVKPAVKQPVEPKVEIPAPEPRTPEDELSIKTAEAKALMTAATRLGADLTAPRSYISQGVQFAKRGDLQTALKYLNDAISLLRDTSIKKLEELLGNLERKIMLLEKHGSNMARERRLLTKTREFIATRDILDAVNTYDTLREMLGIASKGGEESTRETADEFEKLMSAIEKYGIDLHDEKERYESARYTAAPSELAKIRAELMEQLNAKIYAEIAELGKVLVEKKYAGANVKNLAAILKQATIAFKRKQYIETIKYMDSFRKLTGYVPIPKKEPVRMQVNAEKPTPRQEVKAQDSMKIGRGEICLLNTNDARIAYAAASEFIKQDRVFVATTSYPEKLKRAHNLENATFLYLTDSYSVPERCDIRRLDFEVTYEISGFLNEREGGLVLIDDVELISLYNGVSATLNFLKSIIDKAMQNHTALLVTCDLNYFSKNDGAMLRTLFPKVVDKQVDLKQREFGINFQPVVGRSYLIETNTTTMDTLKNLLRGKKSLIITKNFPKKLKEDPKLTDAEIYWLTESEGYDKILRPTRLEFEVMKTILDFMRETHGVVVLDCLSNILLTNEFKDVVDMLKAIDDENSISGSVLIVEMSPGAVEKDKTCLIMQRFDEILRY